jgi:hypothetical protein
MNPEEHYQEKNPAFHDELREVLHATSAQEGGYERLVPVSPSDIEYDKELTTKLYAELFSLVASDGTIEGMDEDPIRHTIREYAHLYGKDSYPIVAALTMILALLQERTRGVDASAITEDSGIPAIRARAIIEDEFHQRYPNEYTARFVELN